MYERRARDGLGSPNRRGHGQFHEESHDENNRDDEENLEDEVSQRF